MFNLCERMQPGIVQDVVIPYCMTDWGGAIIRVKKRNKIDEGWQRNFMSAILSTSRCADLYRRVGRCRSVRHGRCDVEHHDAREPHSDILNPIPGGRGQTFMPAERMTAGDMNGPRRTQGSKVAWASIVRCRSATKRLPAPSLRGRKSQSFRLVHGRPDRQRRTA